MRREAWFSKYKLPAQYCVVVEVSGAYAYFFIPLCFGWGGAASDKMLKQRMQKVEASQEKAMKAASPTLSQWIGVWQMSYWVRWPVQILVGGSNSECQPFTFGKVECLQGGYRAQSKGKTDFALKLIYKRGYGNYNVSEYIRKWAEWRNEQEASEWGHIWANKAKGRTVNG